MQLATSSSQLNVAEGERSFLRDNIDNQMASTAAALREGIATSRKHAWQQHQADAQQREALRAEAVLYAERSDVRARELVEAQQRLQESRDAAAKAEGELQQQLRRAHQVSACVNACLCAFVCVCVCRLNVCA